MEISVFMPVYNGEGYIGDSIKSILDQTFTEFELVILNDGSTDSSVTVIESFNDPRIKLFHNEKNMGLAYTENRCLELCKGKYLAKLDCDDIADPNRLKLQYEYMEANEDVGLLGSAVSIIDSNGEDMNKVWRYPAPKEMVPSLLLFNNYFAHPAVMIRRSSLPDIWYQSEYNPAEDYDLWCRMLQNCNGFNLSEVLTKYRIHDKNISKTQKQVQINSLNQTRKNQLIRLGIELNNEEFSSLDLLTSIQVKTKHDLKQVREVLDRIWLANKSKNIYHSDSLAKVISFFWYKNLAKNLPSLKGSVFLKSPKVEGLSYKVLFQKVI